MAMVGDKCGNWNLTLQVAVACTSPFPGTENFWLLVVFFLSFLHRLASTTVWEAPVSTRILICWPSGVPCLICMSPCSTGVKSRSSGLTFCRLLGRLACEFICPCARLVAKRLTSILFCTYNMLSRLFKSKCLELVRSWLNSRWPWSYSRICSTALSRLSLPWTVFR